jgi:hypothetical protein
MVLKRAVPPHQGVRYLKMRPLSADAFAVIAASLGRFRRYYCDNANCGPNCPFRKYRLTQNPARY